MECRLWLKIVRECPDMAEFDIETKACGLAAASRQG